MRSLVTDQGTAMPEATLCNAHVTDEANRWQAISNARQAGDWDEVYYFHDSTGNDQVACIVCGTRKDVQIGDGQHGIQT